MSVFGESVGAVDLRARAGVVTGQVAALENPGEGLVVGDRVNTASRVQSSAAPGSVLVRAFLECGPLRSRWRFLPASAHGQLAFGTYLWEDAEHAYVPGGLDVLSIRDGQVAEVVAFLAADFTKFGLPERLPA